MKRVFALLLALGTVGAVLFGTRTASADPFSAVFDVDFVACSSGDPGCNGNANQDAGEPVTTVVNIRFPQNGMSFLDSSVTMMTGIDPKTGLPVGLAIGSNTFDIKVTGTTPCGPASGGINPTFTIYNGHVHGVHDGGGHPYPPGYGDGSGAPLSTNFPDWIQDFDDDNDNNVVDSAESPPPDATTIPESIEDADNDGVPDGADPDFGPVEPLFIPLLDAIVGSTHDIRGLGVAEVLPGPTGVSVPVDFVTYKDFPVAGTHSLVAAITSGAGLGLLPPAPPASVIITCPPFSTTVTTFGVAGGQVVQELTGNGMYQYQFSVAEDWDGDGVAQYNDNCDAVPNADQADGDNDDQGDACEGGVPGPDADNDGYPNVLDSCPASPITTDNDDDGVTDGCDPDDNEIGDGDGYADPAPGILVDNDMLWRDPFLAGANEGFGDLRDSWMVRNSNDRGGIDWLDIDRDGTPEYFDAGDTDGDGFSDLCETGRLLENMSGSDALDAQSTPGGGAVAGDCDNDGTGDATDPTPLGAPLAALAGTRDSDGDGCADAKEVGAAHATGGQRDRFNPFDFADMPNPYSATYTLVGKNKAINATDVLNVRAGTGTSYGQVAYNAQFDRTPSLIAGQPWRPGPPNGSITAQDVLTVRDSSGDSCI